MKKYNLTIISETRFNFSIVILIIGLIFSIFVGVFLGNLFYGLLPFILIFYSLYYFTIRQLTIFLENGELEFQWTNRKLFNYEDISPIKLSNIKTIVLDNGEFLRKLITSDRVIRINNSRIMPKDASKFIRDLKKEVKIYDIELIDSWDSITKEYLKVLYWTIITVSSIGGILLITIIILKGFQLNLLFMLAVLPSLLIVARQIKGKIEKRIE